MTTQNIQDKPERLIALACPYVMPANLSPENRALWQKTEADNKRNAKAYAARLRDWHTANDARIRALKPAGPGPLFNGAQFVALDTVEHSIHQALGSLHQADDDDMAECSDRFDAREADHPHQALRYFMEREKARGENWKGMIAVLTIRTKLAGGNNAA